MFKYGLLFISLLVGSLALPALEQEADKSIFFDHTNPSSSRIVGGTTAGEVPHMAVITNGILLRSLLCGASVITNRHILTAAHCIEAVFSWGSLSSSLRITVGTNRWNTGGFHYNLSGNITHPNYVESIIKNDIGFLITSTNIAFSSAVQPVTLNYDWIGTGVATRVNGWGRTTAGGSISAVLLELRATTVDGEYCNQQVNLIGTQLGIRNIPPVETHIEICTFQAVNQATCNGDSGSPLLRADLDEQIGVVSWGIPCGRGAPDMFARVSAYRDWILRSIA